MIEEFFSKNQKQITEIVLQKWSSDENYWADYYLVNKSEYSKTGIIDLDLDNIDNVIDRCINKWSYVVTKNGSFHLWWLTIQMKWSWKGESYHWLQFNKKWI